MAIRNEEVCRRWAAHLQEHGKAIERLSGGTIFVREGTILYRRVQSGWSSRPFTDILAEWVPRSKLVLLNGNGMTDRSATHWQTHVRNLVRRDRERVNVVIPFAALIAAGINRQTIRCIFVVNDENELRFREVEAPPPLEEMKELSNSAHSRTYEGTSKSGQLYQVYWPVTRVYTETATGKKTLQRPGDIYSAPGKWKVSEPQFVKGPHIQTFRNGLHRPNDLIFQLTKEDREARVARVEQNNNLVLQGQGWREWISADIPPADDKWYEEVTVHHLGACLFSAETDDGRRHKFLSAFDEEEQAGAMYFLAQLPDNSGATTYDEAISALAPPLVHEARKQGRNVRRQGDVFAIETNLTDKEVYALAYTRVRRDVALFALNRMTGRPEIRLKEDCPELVPGEVFELHECPTCGGHRHRIGWGPKAHRALMIYGTGHTATEVVKTKKGTTYIRGTMYHDPYLETLGRTREHRDVPLAEGKWHIAVRNTVPRRRQRVEQGEEVTA